MKNSQYKLQSALLLLTVFISIAAIFSSCGFSLPSLDTTDTNAISRPGESFMTDNSQTSDDTDATEPSESAAGSASRFILTQESVVDNQSYALFSIYKKYATAAFLIPGLKQYVVPQGMDIWEEKNLVIVSGYLSDTSIIDSSVLVAIDMTTGEYVGEYYIKNIDGTPHTSHAGGIAITSKNLFISNNKTLFRIPLESISSVNQAGDVKIVETIQVPVRASFCNFSADTLWVGDFYLASSYPTDDFRHMKNNDGNMYYAWCVGYDLTDTTENEFKAEAMSSYYDFATPDRILSIDERIQGFTVVSDKYIALSQSYGRKNNSTIYLYDNILSSTPHKTVALNGKSVPLWFLDSKAACHEIVAPPMAEGLACTNGELYILYESGADKHLNNNGSYPTDYIWKMIMP